MLHAAHHHMFTVTQIRSRVRDMVRVAVWVWLRFCVRLASGTNLRRQVQHVGEGAHPEEAREQRKIVDVAINGVDAGSNQPRLWYDR